MLPIANCAISQINAPNVSMDIFWNKINHSVHNATAIKTQTYVKFVSPAPNVENAYLLIS
jgi:hypothetical protein